MKKGSKHTLIARKKQSLSHLGKATWNKGLTKSDPRVARNIQTRQENNPNWAPRKGMKNSSKWYKAMSKKTSGINHWNWKNGATEQARLVRSSHEWKQWRKAVYERDNYTCQKCKQKGSHLNPHHIKPRHTHPDLIFDVNNGITYCLKCHSSIHNKSNSKHPS